MSREPLRLKTNGRNRILKGHVWAYRSELEGLENAEPGGIRDLVDGRGRFLGRGYANPLSEISFRLLTRTEEPIDENFLRRRLEAALELRRRENLLAEPSRLVFSESDGLPGFTLDRYAGTLVLSVGTAGADRLREIFLGAVRGLLPGLRLYERSESPSRKREGLPTRAGFVENEGREEETTLDLLFDGIPATVDIAAGQKTGAYLDVRDFRRHLREHATGASVLDVFAHIGLFSRYAAAGGATAVTAVETDPDAAGEIRRALPDAMVLEENAFDSLRTLERSGARFDRVVLDPPPFSKSAGAVKSAIRGYREVNIRGMKLVAPGGLLYTSSCSYHVSRELFLETLRAAAADAGRTFRILEFKGAAPDHPALLNIPETDYLKGAILELV